MADLHHLPAPAPPEGWTQTAVGTWERGPCKVGYIASMNGYLALLGERGRIIGMADTLNEAITAVERAWCNCGIKEVKRG